MAVRGVGGWATRPQQQQQLNGQADGPPAPFSPIRTSPSPSPPHLRQQQQRQKGQSEGRQGREGEEDEDEPVMDVRSAVARYGGGTLPPVRRCSTPGRSVTAVSHSHTLSATLTSTRRGSSSSSSSSSTSVVAAMRTRFTLKDDEEIYDDGTSITNQTVSGVRNVRAMFENSKTNHPLSRGFSAKPVGAKPAVAPPAAVGSKSGETTAAKRQVLPTTAEKPALRPVKPSSSPGAGAAAGMRSPPVALKPTGLRSPEAKEPNNNATTTPNRGRLGSSNIGSNISSNSNNASNNDTPPITDFRSMLKKTNRTPGSVKTPQAVAVATGGTVKTTELPKEEEKKDGGEEEAPAMRSGARGWKESAVRRSIVTRQHDSKRFRRNPPPSSSASSEAAPPKPPLPPGVDLAPLLQQYQAELARCGAEVEGEMEETYDDVGVAPSNRPVSMLPEMTEEEELGREAEAAASAETDEVYDDAMAAPGDKNPDEESDGETYEDLSELVQQQQDSGGSADTTSIKSEKEKNDKEAAKLKKQEEKERKEREKKEKEEKKKMERKKKEERDMRAKFKLQLEGDIELQGEGVIKKDAKGRGADLTVKATDKVGIVRMNGNPKGKWLVQNQEGKLGYVDANNVEMMNAVAGGADGAAKSPGPPSNGPSGGGDDEVYDPVDAVDDDIYEEM